MRSATQILVFAISLRIAVVTGGGTLTLEVEENNSVVAKTFPLSDQSDHLISCRDYLHINNRTLGLHFRLKLSDYKKKLNYYSKIISASFSFEGGTPVELDTELHLVKYLTHTEMEIELTEDNIGVERQCFAKYISTQDEDPIPLVKEFMGPNYYFEYICLQSSDPTVTKAAVNAFEFVQFYTTKSGAATNDRGAEFIAGESYIMWLFKSPVVTPDLSDKCSGSRKASQF